MEEEKLKRRKEKANNSNRRQFADACNDLATYYAKHQRYSDALDEYKLQASVCDELGLQMKWAACQRMIGEMYLLMAEFDKALKYVRHHLDIAKDLKNLTEEVKAMEAIGRIHLVQGQSFSNKEKSETSLKAAEKAFMESLALCESRHSKTSQHDLINIQAKILLNIGDVQEHLGFFDNAINYIGKAITICNMNEGLDDVLHNCYTTEASMHSNKKDYAKALACLNKALEVTSRLEDQAPKTCEALILKADILCQMSEYRGAKEVLHNAWKLETPNEKERKNIEFNFKVVVAMCETEDLLLSNDPSDHVTFKKLYEKLGDGACRLKNYSGAVEYYLKMLGHAVRAGDCGTTLGPIYVSLYQTYKDMGCYNEALAYCEKEYELIKDEPKEAITTLYNIAEILFLANKPYSAVEKACIDAWNAAQKWNLKNYEIGMLKTLLKYQLKYGETDKMEQTKAELHALGYDDFDNLANSAEEQSSGGDADTTHVGDDVRLEDLQGLSDTNKKKETEKPRVADQRRETNNIILTRNQIGETLLHRACMSGNKHKVESLLANGHPVNIRDEKGWLPLHDACVHGRLEIVNILINSGADVNARSYCGGSTPLHVAASKGHLNVVQLLLEKGAIPSVKDALDKTTLDSLTGWRSLQYRLPKEKKVFYKYICDKMSNLIENPSGVNYDISESKSSVKPIKDISLPSTSKSGNNIQDIIIIDDSDEEIIESQNNKNIPYDTNVNQVTESVLKSNDIKKEMECISSDVDENENISDNFKDNGYVCSDVIVDEPMLNTNREIIDSSIKNTKGVDFDTSESLNPVKPIEDIILLTNTSKMSSNNQECVIVCDSDDDLDKLQNNRNQSKFASNDTNMNQVTEPVSKSNNIKEEMEWCINNNVDVNENISDNFQDTENVCSDVSAYNSMLNISRQLIIDCLIKNAASVPYDTSESKVPVNPVKYISQPSTSKIDEDKQKYVTVYGSNEEIVESQNITNEDLGINKQNKKRKLSKPLSVVGRKPSLDNHKNSVKEINNCTGPVVEGNNTKKLIATESMLNTSIKLNNNLVEHTGGELFDTVNPVKDTILPSTSEICKNIDDFLIFDDSMDSDEFPFVNVKKSITPVKPKKNISLSNTLKINSNIQALPNNKNQRAFLSEDFEILNAQSLNHKTVTVITGVKDYTSDISALINKNADKITEDKVNESIPVLLTTSEIVNDNLDMNKHNKKRKLNDPSNVVAKKLSLDNRKNSLENINKVTEPLVESKKVTNRKKSLVSDDLDVNSFNSEDFLDNENVCSEVIAAESMLNTSRELNESLIESGVDFNTSISNTLVKSIKDMSQPSTSKMSNIPHINLRTLPSNNIESSDAYLSNHNTEISGVKKHRKSISVSMNRSPSKFPEDEVNKSMPALLTSSEMSHDKLDDNLGISKRNDNKKKRKLSDALTVIAKKRLLNSGKNSIENIKIVTKPLVESKKITKRKKSRGRDDVDENKNSSNADNIQNNGNIRSEVIAAISMLNIGRELKDSLIERGVDFETSDSNTAVRLMTAISQPRTSSINIQNKNLTTSPSNEIESSDAHTTNHKTDISDVKKHRSAISTSINKIINEFPEDNSQVSDYVDVNEKCLNSDNFQDCENVCAKTIAAKSMPNITRELNESSIGTTGGVDFAISVQKIPVNPIKDISLPSSSKISNYIQESQTNQENQTGYPPEDTQSSDHQIVCHQTEMSDVKEHRSVTSTSINKNASEFPEDESQVSDNVDVNKNRSNSDTFQANKNMSSEVIEAESMISTSSFIEYNGGVDLDTSEPKTSNAIKDVVLPRTSEISIYIQESRNNKNLTAFSSEDAELLNSQFHKTETSMKINASKFSADINKSVPALFTLNQVGNDELHGDFRINKQNNKKVKGRKVKKRATEKKKRNKRRQTTTGIFSRRSSSKKYRNTNGGFEAVQNVNPSIKQVINEIKPINSAQQQMNCPIQKQTLPPVTVRVCIGDEMLLISLDSDMINTLTISWLVKEVKSRYHKLSVTNPVFILMTSDGAILSEDDPLKLVVSSPELKACFTNCEVSPEEAHYLESRYAADIYDEITRDITDDVLFLPRDGSPRSTLPHAEPDKSLLPTSMCSNHDTPPQPNSPRSGSPLTSLLCPKREKWPQPRMPLPGSPQPYSLYPKQEEWPQTTSPHPESPQPYSLYPKQETSPQPSSPRPNSPRPGSLAQPTSPGCGFSGPALPSTSMSGTGSTTNPQDHVIPLQLECFDEQELDDETLQLLGDAPRTEIRLGPPVHKAVAKRWQEILAKGLQKEVTDQIMEVYSVPANCDLLLAPTLNPEVKATVRENTASLDSSLMEQQKQLGLAISALGTAVNSILLNETSKRMILKPISDACRLLCDIHFRETETRRHNVITSTAPELQDSLANTVRSNQLFGDNVTEKIKSEK